MKNLTSPTSLVILQWGRKTDEISLIIIEIKITKIIIIMVLIELSINTATKQVSESQLHNFTHMM